MSDRVQSAHAFFQLRQFELAEKEVRTELAENPHNASAHAMLGVILIDLGRGEEAEQSVRSAVRSNPQLTYAHRATCIVLSKLDRFDEALSAIKEALRLAPDNLWNHQHHMFCLYRLGLYREAIHAAKRGLALNAEDAFCTNKLAWANYQLGNDNEATIACNQAMSLDPLEYSNYSCMACLERRKGNPMRARELLLESLRLEPTADWEQKQLIEVTYECISDLYATGKLDEASEMNDELITISPKDPRTLFNQAMDCIYAGEVYKALDYLRLSRERQGYSSPWIHWLCVAFVRTAGFTNAGERMIRKVFSRRQLQAIGGGILGLLVAIGFHMFQQLSRTPKGQASVVAGAAVLAVALVFFYDMYEKHRNKREYK